MIVTLPLVETNQVVSGPQPEQGPGKGLEKGQEICPRSKLVLSLIQKNPSVSRKEIAEHLNLTDKQVRTTIENLKAREIIYRDGPNKGGKWIINPKR